MKKLILCLIVFLDSECWEDSIGVMLMPFVIAGCLVMAVTGGDQLSAVMAVFASILFIWNICSIIKAVMTKIRLQPATSK